MKLFSLLSAALLCASAAVAAGAAVAAEQQGLQATSPRVEAAKKRGGGPSEEETRAYFTDTPLLDQDGKPLKFYSDLLQNKTVIINFVYTTCQDACPLQTAKLVQVKDAVGERFGKDIFFVSISVDPLNDTPAALKDFAVRQRADHPAWRFLTGKPEDVFNVIKRLGQFTDDKATHSTGMILGNVKTRHWVMVNPIMPSVALSLRLESFADEG